MGARTGENLEDHERRRCRQRPYQRAARGRSMMMRMHSCSRFHCKAGPPQASRLRSGRELHRLSMLGDLELRPGIPPGTLEMLVLRTLAAGSERERRRPWRRTTVEPPVQPRLAAITCAFPQKMHGFQIAESILRTSEEIFLVEEGSLYPALQRLLAQGSVKAEWGRTNENRRARYCRITAAGRRRLEQETAQYRKVARAILLILGPEAA
jgi:PadR family transcriptional regulator, regulatory protein PadR